MAAIHRHHPPPPDNKPKLPESKSSMSRITREGKKITYVMRVMQEPEKARACGAGQKSAADRRPVDPPPVVELRIFESADPDDELAPQTDITFAYSANFFLFATLETVRPIAQGRLPSAPNCPVLTGVPVAGVAYLDRPHQAGYFIFPDLSVRHEGYYRLNFHLYEETKLDKDKDAESPVDPSPTANQNPMKPTSSLSFRLNLYSHPFVVYSAKKFPGLNQSTSLSRIIAEQGCRVRIRRDVRMRRRENKRPEDFDMEDEGMYRSSDRFATPEAFAERARSASIGSVNPGYAYSADAQRRPSVTDYAFQGAQPYPRAVPPSPAAAAPAAPMAAPAVTAPQAPSYQSHLSFGSMQAQYQTPQLSRTPQPASTPVSYSPHPAYAQLRKSSVGTELSPGNSYPQSHPPAERSGPAMLPPIRYDHQPPVNAPAPVERRVSEPTPYQSAPQPASSRPQKPAPILPSLSTLLNFAPDNPNPSHEPSSGKTTGSLYETPSTVTKRTYEETFGHDDRPLQNGMRPDTESYPGGHSKPVEDPPMGFLSSPGEGMTYKRANGQMRTKQTPAVR